MSHAEDELQFQLKAEKLWDGFVREYKFMEDRKFRFDFAHPASKLAIEIDGGQWIKGGGRHNRPAGFEKDLEKLNLAALRGWTTLRFTPSQVKKLDALNTIKLYLKYFGEAA